jgi:hypothetical protein
LLPWHTQQEQACLRCSLQVNVPSDDDFAKWEHELLQATGLAEGNAPAPAVGVAAVPAEGADSEVSRSLLVALRLLFPPLVTLCFCLHRVRMRVTRKVNK